MGWVRYDENAPYPDVDTAGPHIAFEVVDTEQELKGKKSSLRQIV